MSSTLLTIVAVFAALAAPAFAQDKPNATPNAESAVFAGGCFWCVEEAFDKVEGVIETTSGYTGGTVENPSYEQVSAGGTGHYEAVRVRYDSDKVSYERLLDVFWRNIDPFDPKGQFCDKGASYRAAIFTESEDERRQALGSKQEVAQKFDKPIATEILPAKNFYAAEDYHQNYYEKNPLRYRYYKWSCGRAQRLEEIWETPGSS